MSTLILGVKLVTLLAWTAFCAVGYLVLGVFGDVLFENSDLLVGLVGPEGVALVSQVIDLLKRLGLAAVAVFWFLGAAAIVIAGLLARRVFG